MRSLERGKRHESLGTNISRIAYAYGFTASPVAISKKSLANVSNDHDKTAASMALIHTLGAAAPLANPPLPNAPLQTWGVAHKGSSTFITFAITASREAIAHALVVKTALSIAESAGYTNISVRISSIGDAESKKRFSRELANFFRKNHEGLAPEIKQLVAHNPEGAYHALIKANDPALARAPRSIDYLSESSRKTMLSTLSLFESVGIAYSMHPRIAGTPGVHSEVLFTIEGTDKRGDTVEIASGGRYDDHAKRERGKAESAVAIAIEIPERVECEAEEEDPSCFVVHVGEQAKLRAFSMLDALWRAQIAVGQALMAENLRDQMQKGALSNAKYYAIIGQREALDNTVIVRTVLTQAQTTLPLEKLSAYVTRARH